MRNRHEWRLKLHRQRRDTMYGKRFALPVVEDRTNVADARVQPPCETLPFPSRPGEKPYLCSDKR
ncbi:hypothetical protein ACQQ2N_01075 [Dokdonella sp. MW10]|uniref:hypothetical protein n=1 Tax=Dokdonella sp. MW10 TaxID=2992926 RepID=UPI003F7E315D